MIFMMATKRADLDRLSKELAALSPEERRHVLEATPPRTERESKMPLGDWLAAAGPWEGESTDEILAILREGRALGGSAEPPNL